MPADYRERSMWRVARVAAAAALLVAGCGGADGPDVERSEFIVELENPLGEHLEEPTVYGQAGLSPDGDDRTRVVIVLDERFEPAEAEIHRSGCRPFYPALSVYKLGRIDDDHLEAVVDVSLRDLRGGGHALVVRGPYTSRDPDDAPPGTCGDLSTAEPTEEPEAGEEL